MNASEGWVWLARIKRTQGRKGEVFAEILTDFPEKFSQRRRLWLLHERISSGTSAQHAPQSDNPESAREVELVHHWLHKGGVVLHFASVDSISAAEQLSGLIVAIPRSQRAQLAEGDIYIADLIGCTLVDVGAAEPRTIGEIEDVDRTLGPVAMLAVKPARRQDSPPQHPHSAGDEILIPFADEYLRKVDLLAKRIEMALPEGLLDLNRTPER